MPYIKQERREVLDKSINDLIFAIKSLPEDELEGACNYTVTRVVVSSMKPSTGWRYNSLSRAHEVFKAAGAEMWDRLIRNYEDGARIRNGDLLEYKQF